MIGCMFCLNASMSGGVIALNRGYGVFRASAIQGLTALCPILTNF